jgi:hypothetical protein
MPINPPVSVNPTPYTASDIVRDAMIEVGMIAPGEVPDGDSGQWAFRKLNYLLDHWAAQDLYVYSNSFNLFNLVVGLSPHTIGPGDGVTPATFTVEQRPVRIESAAIVLDSNGLPVDIPIPIEDDDWWAENRLKTLQSQIPTHLYYSADWPNGSLYFWPVPNAQYQVRLQYWTLLRQFASIDHPLGGPNSAASLPPAYRSALMLTLAETLQPGARQSANPALSMMAAKAREAITQNNAPSPRISTAGAGMPSNDRHTRFNFLTGQPW